MTTHTIETNQLPYQPETIENEAQEYWESHHSFNVKEDLNKEKFYCLTMLPYPSGDLHMGHVRVYTIGDVIARQQRMLGKNVLQPIGWDAFGMPAENAAIERQLKPSDWTFKQIKKMRAQFKRLGYGYDWNREITTCDVEYYRWEQWFFVQLFKKGLAYKKDSYVNWDPVDKTVLANEQVINGCGWRSGAKVERRKISQWFLKITDYAEELLEGLNHLPGWPDEVKTMQRNWIARSSGAIIQFALEQTPATAIEIFTTRADTLMGVSYLAIAPEHPVALAEAKKNPQIAHFIDEYRNVKVAEAEMATLEKRGIATQLTAKHPITGESIPVWITNFVLMEYGSGAVMAVPAHDERDFEFAKQYHLPIKPVIKINEETWDYQQQPLTAKGVLINSGAYDGLSSEQATQQFIAELTKQAIGREQIQYRLRDWGISRQRYWGAPIPIIYCDRCGTVPVPETDLPVVLPLDIIPTGHGSPLAACEAFVNTTCPQCGGNAKRETDTMDTFVESSWYYARYCCVDQNTAMLDDRAKYWTPVDQYVGGIEHAVLHLLYARFFQKLLRDLGLLNNSEPFTRLLTQGMVLKDGHKMSKSKGNVVSPQTMINQYGADTIRLFMIFAAPPELALEWSDSGVEGCHRYLKRLWDTATTHRTHIKKLNDSAQLNHSQQHETERQQLHQILQQALHDFTRTQFNTVVSAAMKILNLLQTIAPDSTDDYLFLREGFEILLRLLAPITPHICHSLWHSMSYGANVLVASWPTVDNAALITSSVDIMVQINGKLRGKLTLATGLSQSEIEAAALASPSIQKYIQDQNIKKIIVVPNKLINIVI